MILATRVRCALEATGIALLQIDEGFKDWLVNAAASFVANVQLAYGEKLMKAVSHVGGVRVHAYYVQGPCFRN